VKYICYGKLLTTALSMTLMLLPFTTFLLIWFKILQVLLRSLLPARY